MQRGNYNKYSRFNQWWLQRLWFSGIPSTLAMNGVDIPLDGLTVAHLVSAVVARNGFKQELQMDMLDDEYILYRKEDTAVTFKETYNHLSYDNGSEKSNLK